jgi:holo-[acyl-carrier protein] synthase
MILGIGTDITSVDRFINSQQHMERMANRILTEYELKEFNSLKENHGRYLAKKWAAKEAVSKAFGTGIAGDTKFKSIEIRHDSNGKPIVIFWNKLKDNAETLKLRCHLSISDEVDTVVAYTVIEYHV